MTILVPVVIAFGHAIFKQDAGDASGRHPVTYLSPLKVHRQKTEPAAGENHHRRARILTLGRKDRHGWRGYVIGYDVRAPRDDIRRLRDLDSLGRLRDTRHVRRTVRPDRDLFESRRRLPDADLPVVCLLPV